MRLIIFPLLIFLSCSKSQHIMHSGTPEYLNEIKAYQAEVNANFADPEKSPLTEKDLKSFKGLKFFPINEKFRVTAKLTMTPEAKPFKMPTSSSKLKTFRKYGVAEFSIDRKPLKLGLYQNAAHANHPLYKNLLFLPFRDLTTGKESYGGGRYIDLEIPEGNEIVIDFNKAYNPLCAYNTGYSCPVPPKENDLDIEIRAGVMAFDH